MIIYLAGLQVIPTELYEAADIDGAGRWQQFVHLTWPLLGRINLVVFILLLVNSLRVFQEVFVMTGGGPADSTITVPFLIYNEAFRFFRFGRAAAMSYVLFVLVVAVNIVQTSLASRKLDY